MGSQFHSGLADAKGQSIGGCQCPTQIILTYRTGRDIFPLANTKSKLAQGSQSTLQNGST